MTKKVIGLPVVAQLALPFLCYALALAKTLKTASVAKGEKLATAFAKRLVRAKMVTSAVS